MSFKNHSLLISRKGDTKSFRLAEVSLIVVHAGVQLTSVVIAELLDRGLETIFMRQDGQFRGRLFSCDAALSPKFGAGFDGGVSSCGSGCDGDRDCSVSGFRSL